MDIELQSATLEDIDEVLALHYCYQIDSIKEEDKVDGFITTAFTKAHLTGLIEQENGLFVARIDKKIVAYAMAASWAYWSQWPMFRFMIDNLHDSLCCGDKIHIENSYQYGPVCVDKSVRGKGVFEHIFNYSLKEMSKRYPIMVTFINKINPRSYQAHINKTPLLVIKDFDFNDNNYYKLACKTA
tara:strand:+ start:3967 stop:4521 length:555 start_codon:yes stop_codon:yes gene_type:complete